MRFLLDHNLAPNLARALDLVNRSQFAVNEDEIAVNAHRFVTNADLFTMKRAAFMETPAGSPRTRDASS